MIHSNFGFEARSENYQTLQQISHKSESFLFIPQSDNIWKLRWRPWEEEEEEEGEWS